MNNNHLGGPYCLEIWRTVGLNLKNTNTSPKIYAKKEKDIIDSFLTPKN